jgi:hypothetical protein
MELSEELLAQDYTIAIYEAPFEGEQFETLTFTKEIESENYLINLEISVTFKFESHEYCEVDDAVLESITVEDDNGKIWEIGTDLHKEINLLIDTYYE